MNHREEIVEKFRSEVEKQNPWQPYRGPAGGQGWQNLITGEVRYQENRPAPGEGVPEEYEGEIPTPEEEPPEELEPPTEEELLAEHLDEGDEITFDLMDVSGEEVEVEGIEGEVTLTDSDYGPKVRYEHPESGYQEHHQISWEEVDTSPYQLEPTDGWAEGWVDPPDDYMEYWEGQRLEVYDTDANEYREVELVNRTQEFFTVEDVETGETLSVVLGDAQAGDAMLTASEDPLTDIPGNTLDPIDPEEFAHMTEGDEIIHDPPDGPPRVVELEETPSPDHYSDHFASEILDEDGLPVTVTPESSIYQASTVTEPEESLYWDGEMHWDEVEDQNAVFDHPVFGEIEGSVGVSKDPEGYEWLTITQKTGDLEEGDEITFENDWGEEHEGVVESFDDGHILVDPDPDEPTENYYELDYNDVDEFEEVSLTTNPEHPLYVGEHVEQVNSPWTPPPSDPEGWDDVGAGSQIYVEDPETGERSVETVIEGGYYPSFEQAMIETPSGTYTDDELDTVVGVDTVDELPVVPYDAMTDEWQGIGSKFTQETGDTLLYVDENGDVRTSQIDDFVDDETAVVEDLGEKEEVDVDQVISYADTGDPLPEEAHPWTSISEGSVVSASYIGDGEVEEAEGMIVENDGTNISILTEDGETLSLTATDAVITEHHEDADPSEYRVGDGLEMETEEIVSDIRPEGGWVPSDGKYLSKTEVIEKFWEAKSEQQSLKADFKKFFDPKSVEKFYEDIKGWKGSSRHAREIESAFALAHGIDAPLRGQTKPDEPIPYTEDEIAELVKMAEVASTISGEFYDDHIGEFYRGGKSNSLVTAIASFLEDPDKEVYDIDGLVLNNGDDDPGNTWNNYRIAPGSKIDGEDIMLATDFMFNPFGSHDHENELWVSGDALEVTPDEIHLNHDPNLNFEGAIDEWDDFKLEGVSEEIARYAPRMFEEIGSEGAEEAQPVHGFYGDVNDTQLETLHDIAVEARRRGVAGDDVKEMQSAVEALMDERGLAYAGGDAPDRFETADDFIEDMEITAYNPYTEEVDDFIVTDVWPDSGVVNAEDPMGNLVELEPEDVTDVVWSPDGSHKEPAQYLDGFADDGIVAVPDLDFSVNDLSEGDDIVYEDGFGDENFGTVETVDPDTMDVFLQHGGAIPADKILGIDENSPAMAGANIEEPEPLTDVEPGAIVDHPEFTGEVTVTDVGYDGVEVEDSSGYAYTLTEPHELDPLDEEVVGHKIQGPEDVEPGDVVEVDAAGYDEPVEVDEMYEDPEYGVTGVRIGDDVLDFDQLVETDLPAASQVSPDAVETEVLEPEEFGETLSEGDDVWVEWSDLGEGKPATVTGVDENADAVVVDTGDSSVTVHAGTDKELHVNEENLSGGSGDTPENAADWAHDMEISPGDTVMIDPSHISDANEAGVDEPVEAEIVGFNSSGEPEVHYSDLPWTDPEDYQSNGGILQDEIAIPSPSYLTEDGGGGADGTPAVGDFDDYDAGNYDADQFEWAPIDEVDEETVNEGDTVALVADYDHEDDKTMYVGEAYFDDENNEWKIDVQNHDQPDYNFQTPVNDNDVEAYIAEGPAEEPDMIDSVDDVQPGSGVYVPAWDEEVTVTDVGSDGITVGTTVDQEVATLDPDDVVHPTEADLVEPPEFDSPDPEEVEWGETYYHPIYGEVEVQGEPIQIGDQYSVDVESEEFPSLASSRVSDLSEEPLDDAGGSDGGDAEFQMGDAIDPMDFAVGEHLTVENYGGHPVEVSVVDVPDDPQGPVEFMGQSGTKERFIYWPDGEVEEV